MNKNGFHVNKKIRLFTIFACAKSHINLIINHLNQNHYVKR